MEPSAVGADPVVVLGRAPPLLLVPSEGIRRWGRHPIPPALLQRAARNPKPDRQTTGIGTVERRHQMAVFARRQGNQKGAGRRSRELRGRRTKNQRNTMAARPPGLSRHPFPSPARSGGGESPGLENPSRATISGRRKPTTAMPSPPLIAKPRAPTPPASSAASTNQRRRKNRPVSAIIREEEGGSNLFATTGLREGNPEAHSRVAGSKSMAATYQSSHPPFSGGAARRRRGERRAVSVPGTSAAAAAAEGTERGRRDFAYWPRQNAAAGEGKGRAIAQFPESPKWKQDRRKYPDTTLKSRSYPPMLGGGVSV